MNRIERDAEREERITMDIVVDAYGPEEQAMSWYYYLEEMITFPFQARCREERRISPLKVDEQVTVSEMAPEDDCEREMFVQIAWGGRTFGVPLAQLEPLRVDAETRQAIADWHYWVQRGYELG